MDVKGICALTGSCRECRYSFSFPSPSSFLLPSPPLSDTRPSWLPVGVFVCAVYGFEFRRMSKSSSDMHTDTRKPPHTVMRQALRWRQRGEARAGRRVHSATEEENNKSTQRGKLGTYPPLRASFVFMPYLQLQLCHLICVHRCTVQTTRSSCSSNLGRKTLCTASAHGGAHSLPLWYVCVCVCV